MFGRSRSPLNAHTSVSQAPRIRQAITYVGYRGQLPGRDRSSFFKRYCINLRQIWRKVGPAAWVGEARHHEEVFGVDVGPVHKRSRCSVPVIPERGDA